MEMEVCGNLMGQTNGGRDQNGNNSNISWANNIWELNSSRLDLDWANSNTVYGTAAADTTAALTGGSGGGTTRSDTIAGHALWLQTHDGDGVVPSHRQHQFLYAGDHGTHFHPDPHLMCLKLGKRHYFEDATAASLGERHVAGGFSAVGKRGKPLYGGDGGPYAPVSTTVPRCQVEGCHVVLVNAKDYHRRHRVCEMHSKAPKVVVLGLEQRFCQQCSRFHVVAEFDDSKRSCRRRLAGHNERRRKSSHEAVAARSSSQDNRSMTGRFPYLSSPTGRALSLLSWKDDCWATATPSDLSLRSSAALRELIAENRATILARQLIFDRDWHSTHLHHHHQPTADDIGDLVPPAALAFNHHHQQPMYSEEQQQGWERIHENGSGHVTLDLMQAPSTAFGLLTMRGRSKEEDEECSDLWNSFQDSHVV